MTTFTRAQAVALLRRTRGPEVAEATEARLPAVIDSVRDADLLREMGLTSSQAMDDLGASP